MVGKFLVVDKGFVVVWEFKYIKKMFVYIVGWKILEDNIYLGCNVVIVVSRIVVSKEEKEYSEMY